MKKLLFTMILLIAATTLTWAYSGGTGTPGTPYQIANTSDLMDLSQTIADWDKHFILTADITFDATEANVDWDDDGTADWDVDDQLGFSPIGNDGTMFTGTFNGQEHTIGNIYINRPSQDYIGLFGVINGTTVSNVGIADCDITGDDYVGGLVGGDDSSTGISNCYATGSVTGSEYVGGLVGLNDSSTGISNCYATSSVTGGECVGGLVGLNGSSTINDSYATGSVTGSGYFVGGLVGDNVSSTISDSYATGSVTGSDDCVGGLVGYNNGSSTISNSYATGSVTGYECVGGLVGVNGSSTIINCYAMGNVTGTDDVGGLVGNHNDSSTINNSYAKGDVTRSSGSSISFGGFCGYNNGSTIEYCYSLCSVDCGGAINKGFVGDEMGSTTYNHNFFDDIVSNQSTDAVGAATPTDPTNMQNQATYTTAPADWDFTTIWGICNGPFDNSYPHLQWQESIVTTTPAAPTGWSDGNGGTISTLAELRWLSETIAAWDEDWLLGADIDAAETEYWNCGAGFSPIGNDGTQFSGVFDGDDYTISNLFIIRPIQEFVGLFGVTDGATIENISVVDCDVTGYELVGSLVGLNESSNISNSYVTGIISSRDNVGGLVGANYSIASISNCYATGIISGRDNVGGLVGVNDEATVSNSYSTGEVAGNDNVGGLVGINDGPSTISNCYAKGNVTRSSGANTSFGGFCGYNDNSTIEYCYSIGSVDCGGATDKGFVGAEFGSTTYNHNFFDDDASNQTTGTGATETITADMKNQATYTTAPADWDFTTIWGIDGSTNDGYPYFQWQETFQFTEVNMTIDVSQITLFSLTNEVSTSKVVITTINHEHGAMLFINNATSNSVFIHDGDSIEEVQINTNRGTKLLYDATESTNGAWVVID